MEFCKVFHSGSLLVLPSNIRLGWKSMQVANTLAYYDTAIIVAIKSFIVQAALYQVTFLANCHSADGRSSCRRGAENETTNTDGNT